MASRCELANATTIRAFRAHGKVLIVAAGDLPSPGREAKITQRPERIFPPWYQVLQCERPGVFPDVLVPYKVSFTAQHPEDRDTIRVFHADGEEDVKIEDCGDELATYGQVVSGGTGDAGCPEGADEATGFSKKLSFDEAFADALASLPSFEPTHPDTLETVRVVEIGGLFGGVAGFHDLFVRICRTHD